MTASTIVFLLIGLVLLVVSAEWLVKGATRLALTFGISPLVVGLTVVAFGTSAPEFAVSVMSAFNGKADLALGNVVGSNIFNVLFILGIAALVTPLIVARQLLKLDVPLMIGVSALVLVFGLDGILGRWDGCVLFGIGVWYTVFLIRQSRRETRNAAVMADVEVADAKESRWWVDVGLVVAGVGGLVFGSRLLVDGAVSIAQYFGVSELIIGLTIVSVGTSLPEVATSVVAAFRGQRDIAVGNVVGSNIFNILSVLGLSSIVSPAGIHVAPEALRLDIPVMIAVAVACFPVFMSGYQIGRVKGMAFLASYVCYVMYLILSSGGHPALEFYQKALLYVMAPLLVLGLGVLTFRSLRQGSATANAGSAGE